MSTKSRPNTHETEKCSHSTSMSVEVRLRAWLDSTSVHGVLPTVHELPEREHTWHISVTAAQFIPIVHPMLPIATGWECIVTAQTAQLWTASH